MKKILAFFPILLTGICVTINAQTITQITVENNSEDPIFLQPIDTIGFNKINKGKTTIKVNLKDPVYYNFISNNSAYHPLFVLPGKNIKIGYKDSKTTFSGDNSDINKFIEDNNFTCQAPKEIEVLSPEWKRYNENKLQELYTKLDNSKLSPVFIAAHKQYLNFIYLNQLLSSPQIQRMFLQKELQLSADYYDFLKELTFDDENILYVPKWFGVVNNALEEMEKQNIIPASNEHYMKIYASKIGNEKVRSHYLIKLLELTLEKGYSDDFMAYLADVEPLITDKDALAELPKLTEAYNAAKDKNKNILRGMKMPEFTGNTLSGKEFKLSDFKGKILVIDFWFTGCIPCKAEMPYFDKLSEEMQGKPVQFISASLDTGDQLMATWKKMMEGKDGKSPVLNLNIPQGFKSEFAKEMNIRSVPRIVLVDQEGNIVDAYAKRPSDPKLKQQINDMLSNSENREIANTALQSITQANSSSQRKEILDEFILKNGKDPIFNSTIGMLTFYYCQSLATEGKTGELTATINKINDEVFKRDVAFICASTCWDNKDKKTAEILAKQAAELTEKINEGKKLEGDELQKYPQILSFYGTILIDQNKIKEATPFILKAYENSQKPHLEMKVNYLTILINQQKYAEAKPILEELIKNGMSNETYEEWLKKTYKSEKGSMEGYEPYLASLKKVYENELKEQIAKEQLNETAPLFTLKDSKGGIVSLASLKGKIVLLDFWATWCGPCKQSFPAMQKVVNKYKNDKEVVVLFIDTWEKNPQAATDFLKNNKYDFTLLHDTEKSDTAKDYKLSGIPAKVIIDKDGIIRYSLKGFSGSEEKNLMELSAMIESLR